jgi:hypothetical protein
MRCNAIKLKMIKWRLCDILSFFCNYYRVSKNFKATPKLVVDIG